MNSTMLKVVCVAGDSGGDKQRFVLELRHNNGSKILSRLEQKKPVFYIPGRPAWSNMTVILYAFNRVGRSETSTLQIGNHEYSLQRTVYSTETNSSLKLVLAVIAAFTTLIMSVALIYWLITTRTQGTTKRSDQQVRSSDQQVEFLDQQIRPFDREISPSDPQVVQSEMKSYRTEFGFSNQVRCQSSNVVFSSENSYLNKENVPLDRMEMEFSSSEVGLQKQPEKCPYSLRVEVHEDETTPNSSDYGLGQTELRFDYEGVECHLPLERSSTLPTDQEETSYVQRDLRWLHSPEMSNLRFNSPDGVIEHPTRNWVETDCRHGDTASDSG